MLDARETATRFKACCEPPTGESCVDSKGNKEIRRSGHCASNFSAERT
jgi:hypothetical protein